MAAGVGVDVTLFEVVGDIVALVVGSALVEVPKLGATWSDAVHEGATETVLVRDLVPVTDCVRDCVGVRDVVRDVVRVVDMEGVDEGDGV